MSRQILNPDPQIAVDNRPRMIPDPTNPRVGPSMATSAALMVLLRVHRFEG
jgi:hypothetical protein